MGQDGSQKLHGDKKGGIAGVGRQLCNNSGRTHRKEIKLRLVRVPHCGVALLCEKISSVTVRQNVPMARYLINPTLNEVQCGA